MILQILSKIWLLFVPMNKEIFKITLPVLFGYIPLGMAYGLLAQNAGISPFMTIVASVVIYAGSGQFLFVSLLSVGAGLMEIFIASFLINLRHIFYTMNLLDDISKLKHKFYAMFALTDESFAVIKSQKIDDENREKLYFLVLFLNQIYWVLGSILGVLVGRNLRVDYSGIEFCLTALFVVLAIELFKNGKNYKILFISLFLGVLGVLFVPSKFMLIATLFAGFVLILAIRKWL